MRPTRPLACGDCGTAKPNWFRVDDRQPRIDGKAFGSPYDFGLCLRCQKKANDRMRKRRRIAEARHARVVAECGGENHA